MPDEIDPTHAPFSNLSRLFSACAFTFRATTPASKQATRLLPMPAATAYLHYHNLGRREPTSLTFAFITAHGISFQRLLRHDYLGEARSLGGGAIC